MQPPFDDTELFSRCRNGRLVRHDPAWVPYLRTVRGGKGETLLHHARDPATVRSLLDAGLDPNARDAKGKTPLMWMHDRETNRALLAGGADLHAKDPQGNSVLAHQAGGVEVGLGYGAPDFDALQVLIDAGVELPTPREADAWIDRSESCVSHHMEHASWQRFRDWVRRLVPDDTTLIYAVEVTDDPEGYVRMELSPERQVEVTFVRDGRDYRQLGTVDEVTLGELHALARRIGFPELAPPPRVPGERARYVDMQPKHRVPPRLRWISDSAVKQVPRCDELFTRLDAILARVGGPYLPNFARAGVIS